MTSLATLYLGVKSWHTSEVLYIQTHMFVYVHNFEGGLNNIYK